MNRSKKVIEILDEALEKGISIFLDGEQLRLKVSKGTIPDPVFIALLKLHKEDVKSFLIEQKESQHKGDIQDTIKPYNRADFDKIPLSFSQERLWFIDKFGGSLHYHIPVVLSLKGKIDKTILMHSFRDIVNRHEALRTIFKEEDGKAYQEIQAPDLWELGYTEAQRNEKLKAFIEEEINRPFDLSQDHMLRAHLIKISGAEHLLILVMHHIASDGWSESIFVDELVELYAAKQEKRTPNLSLLPIQYADYAIWQRTHFEQKELGQKLAYWEQKLSGVSPLELPLDFSRPATQSHQGTSMNFVLEPELSDKLHQLAKAEGVTLFMLLLAVFKVLLYRYTGQVDICVGTPTANRTRQEIESLIGFFLNGLALRSDLGGNPGFKQFLNQVKTTTLEAFTHQDIPFEKIVDRVEKGRDLSRPPIFQIMFISQNTPEVPTLKLGDAILSSESTEFEKTKFDLTFCVNQSTDILDIDVQYCTDLFKPDSIARMIDHYKLLLASVITTPEEKIENLVMLSSAEEKQILIDFNDTKTFYPKGKTIIDLFEEQVAQTPEKIVISYEDRELSFGELDELSNRLANYLIKEYKVALNDLVGVKLERSEWMLVAILGILKSGCAYVPIDVDHPEERIAFIQKDSKYNVCIDEVEIEKFHSVQANYSIEFIGTAICPETYAYAIYTSGSTGTPKGVLNNHGGLYNRLLWMRDDLGINEKDVLLQKTPYIFDVSVWELLMPLITGSTLVFAKPGGHKDPGYLQEVIESKSVNIIHFVPSMLGAFLYEVEASKCKSLRHVVCSGETLPLKMVEQFRACLSGIRIHNLYGPTEAAIDVTSIDLTETDLCKHGVTIGSPVANTSIYIVNKYLKLQPVGVPGELLIGGIQVAQGYLNRPELNEAKFIDNPFGGGKLYRTGDLARWLPGGNIAYINRIDNQVKIRGNRIELGEIEHAIQQYDSVIQNAVLVLTDESGNKKLVGYVLGSTSFVKSLLYENLKQKLPDYMIPRIIVELQEFPLTPSGKINRKALPTPDASTLIKEEYVEPRNNVEADLAKIWKELLMIERVGVHDNFFELGGDSIITIQVVSRAKRLGYQLEPRHLFQHQTIAALAEELEHQTTSVTSEQKKLEGMSKLLPIQQWFFELELPERSHYNQSVLLGINKEAKEKDLQELSEALVAHHDVLRFTYSKVGEKWLQYYGTSKGKLEVVDLTETPKQKLEKDIDDKCNVYQRSLDIEKGELIKIVLFKTAPSESFNRLFIVIHHLAVDGVTWRILLDDLSAGLDSLSQNQPLQLGLKSNSYRSWAEKLGNYAISPTIEKQQAYWENIANSYKPLPTDQNNEEILLKDLKVHSIKLDTDLTHALLQETNTIYNTEINDILLGALAQTITNWAGQDNIVMGLESHGREDIFPDIDLSQTAGWFTALYPIALNIERGLNPGNLIKSVKEQLRTIPGKGLGFSLLRYMHPDQKVRHKLSEANWDIVFNYLGQVDNVVQHNNWFAEADESGGDNVSGLLRVNHKIEIVAYISEGQLQVSWFYALKSYDEKTILSLAEQYLKELRKLVSHCVSKKIPEHTVNDSGLAPWVNYKELDQFLDVKEDGISRRDKITSIYPLSPMQEGMLFHGLYDKKSKAYLSQFAVGFGTELQEEAFRKSWEYLFSNYTILRSRYFSDDLNIPVQCIYKEFDLPYKFIDYSNYSLEEQQQKFDSYLSQDYIQGFKFDGAPLVRITLFGMGANGYKMIWSNHHILWDGWSASILMAAFVKTYEAYVNKETPKPKTEDSFQDYIRYLHKQDKYAEQAFWTNYLSSFDSPSLLPFVSKGTNRNKGTGKLKDLRITIDNDFTAQIKSYAQNMHITANTLIQGVWSILLNVYTGQEDITYGVTVSGRPPELPNAEQRVGLYMNTIPFHTILKQESNLSDWLLSLQEGHSLAREYQYTGLNEIQNWTGIQGDFFDSIIVFQNFPIEDTLKQETLLQASNVQTRDQNNYLLSIVVGLGEDLSIKFNYNSLIKDAYIKMLAGHFGHVLKQIVVEGKKTLQEIELISPQEKEQLKGFNNTSISFDLPSQNVVTIFSEITKRTPNAIAVSCKGQKFTYREVDEQSDKLSAYLQKECNILSGDLVGIMLDKSEYWIISILGILKSGAGYVPIDVAYPEERKQFIVEDTGLKTLIIESESLFDVIAYNINIFSIDIQLETLELEAEYSPRDIISKNTAYVIYTSGSTGKPKGVVITHENLITSCIARITYYKEIPSMVLISPFVFDSSIAVIWGTLLTGGNLIIPTNKEIKDSELLRNLFKTFDSLDAVLCVPSYYQFLLDEAVIKASTFKRVIVAGEQLHSRLVKQHYHLTKGTKLYNEYGPTECTIWSTVANVTQEEQTITIGCPIDTVQCYVLGEQLQLLPLGVAGELYLGGKQVAKGYLNRDELTAEKFISNPFDNKTSSKLYKSGDLAQWLPDGKLEFLGRKDDQVKIRGYRVELGEIEKILSGAPNIKNATVLAKEKDNGERYLVAYVVKTSEYEKAKTQKYLKSKIPDYLIPSIIIELEELPLTPNGKTDKKALLKIETSLQSNTVYTAPRNETEEQLQQIWLDLLDAPQIGIHDDFFELGGHSLLAIRVVSAIRKRLDTEITVVEVFAHPNIADLANVVASGSVQKQKLPAIEAVDRPAIIPVSFGQERLWFVDKMEGSSHYHMPAVLRIKGNLDKEVLAYAFTEIVNRHEILRTAFKEIAGQPSQYILPKDQWKLIFKNSAELDNQSLDNYITSQINTSFNLTKDHMLRAELIQLSSQEFTLLIVMHHIAADGWSVHIFVNELIELYRSCKEKREANLLPLPVQYADYAIWQRNHYGSSLIHDQLKYWEEKLHGINPLNFPVDYARPRTRTTQGKAFNFLLDKTLSEKLNKLCRAENVTLFMFLLAAFKVLLHRYTNQEDICVGTPSANRTRKEVEPLIGFFINMIALRSTIEPTKSFRDLLGQIKQTTLEAYTHQDVPFDKVIEQTAFTRSTNQHPIFQVLFALQNNPETTELILPEVSISSQPFDYENSKFDLTFDLTESEQGIQGVIVYSQDLFAHETIEWMSNHYQTLLASIVTDPAQPLNAISMIGQTENEKIQSRFNNTCTQYPKDKTIVELFESQVAKTPEKIALIFGEEQMTYAELNKRANQLAHCLTGKGIKPHSRVGVLCYRGFEMIISMLGILKCRASYVPLNTDYPLARLNYILEDASATHIVYNEKVLLDNSGLKGYEFIKITNLESYPETALTIQSQIQDIVYLIYTSGTTGTPKGILVNHRNIVKLAFENKDIAIHPTDRVLQWSNFAFDGSTYDIYSSLLNGASLCLIKETDAPDPQRLAAIIREHKLTVCFMTTALFNAFVDHDLEALNLLRKLLFGGEMVSTPHVQKALDLAGSEKLVHVYGPTETTVYATYYPIRVCDRATIPIGYPLSNTSVHILTSSGQVAGIGVPGEIYIGGHGVAQGYLNKVAITTEKFIENHLDNTKHPLLYKTGDIGRYLSDGSIEFMGRKDTQIKMRGYRIELGEIETAFQEHQSISQCVVITQQDNSGNKELVAYILTKKEFDKSEIQEYLQTRLPSYMIPAIIMKLDELPLTPNGKIDKKALPAPNKSGLMLKEYIAPRSKAEQTLNLIWKELLNIDQISIHDNFFELGGHSLLGMQLISRVKLNTGVKLSVADLFRYPTIATLSQRVASLPVEQMQHIPQIPQAEVYEVSHAQKRLWIMDQLSEQQEVFNIPAGYEIKGNLDISCMERALEKIVKKHEILRTCIISVKGNPYQKIVPAKEANVKLKIEHISPSDDIYQLALDLFNEESNRVFSLDELPLFRMKLLTNGKRNFLLVNMHHIISDGWSLQILQSEILNFYYAYAKNKSIASLKLPIQYKDYAAWQNQLAATENGADEQYWMNKLAGIATLPDLPTDKARPQNRTFETNQQHLDISAEQVEKLNKISTHLQASSFIVLQSLLKIFLSEYLDRADIVLGTPVAGRNHPDLENQIGFYVNMVVLRSLISKGDTFYDSINKIKEDTLYAFEHQFYPFDLLVDKLKIKRDLSRNPLFDIVMKYNDSIHTTEHTMPGTHELDFLNLEAEEEDNVELGKYDISFNFVKTDENAIRLNICYNRYLFEQTTITEMKMMLEELINSCLHSPEIPLVALLNSNKKTLLIEDDF